MAARPCPAHRAAQWRPDHDQLHGPRAPPSGQGPRRGTGSLIEYTLSQPVGDLSYATVKAVMSSKSLDGPWIIVGITQEGPTTIPSAMRSRASSRTLSRLANEVEEPRSPAPGDPDMANSNLQSRPDDAPSSTLFSAAQEHLHPNLVRNLGQKEGINRFQYQRPWGANGGPRTTSRDKSASCLPVWSPQATTTHPVSTGLVSESRTYVEDRGISQVLLAGATSIRFAPNRRTPLGAHVVVVHFQRQGPLLRKFPECSLQCGLRTQTLSSQVGLRTKAIVVEVETS